MHSLGLPFMRSARINVYGRCNSARMLLVKTCVAMLALLVTPVASGRFFQNLVENAVDLVEVAPLLSIGNARTIFAMDVIKLAKVSADIVAQTDDDGESLIDKVAMVDPTRVARVVNVVLNSIDTLMDVKPEKVNAMLLLLTR